MKEISILFSLALLTINACAQKNKAIDITELIRIETTLASDEMRGRAAGTPDIDKAASFIADEFKKSGLQPIEGKDFLQRFVMLRPKTTTLKAEIEDKEIDIKNVVIVSTKAELKLNEKSGFETEYIRKGENLSALARKFATSGKNLIVLVDTSFAVHFQRLSFIGYQIFKRENDVIFLLGNKLPAQFTIKAEQSLFSVNYSNVVGIIPGKSRKDEFVIFSAHYDHLGVAKQPKNGDSIFNGANDNAAGTTAVILLADHFKKINNNERTLVFVAFTAEEAGGYGARYFSERMDPAKVMAMFNIEMIGTESKWGRNSAFITGYDKSDMGKIMQNNLQGTSFTFHPDPYTKENLFYRSDNATLARLGVPAHTISTAKMENEPNYHQVTDHVSTLDLENMAEIIKAIAISSSSIISAKDTPTRVKPENLN